MSNTNANFPAAKPDWMSMEWYAFFLALFNRTGGAGSPIDINSLQKQDEISQDVPPQNAATIAALQGVNDLWAEQRAPENLTDIRNRLVDLESTLQAYPDLGPIAQKLNDLEGWLADIKLPASVVIEQWNTPSFLNSWINYGSTRNPVGYFKDPFGIVHLRGVAKSGTIGTAIFNLPAGYRPTNQEVFPVVSNGTFGYCDVFSSGDVVASSGTNLAFALDGMTFRAA